MREPNVHLPRLKSSLIAILFLSLSTIPAARGEATPKDTDPIIPPSVSIPNIIEGGYYNREIIPRIVIRSRSLKTSTAYIDGSPYLPGTPISQEGIHTLVVLAEDTNNTSASLRTTFIIDKTPPGTEIAISGSLTDDRGTLVVTGSSVIVVSSHDPGASPSGIEVIECRLDGGDRQPYVQPISLFGIDDGTHTLHCAATDRAGNREEERKLSFLLANYPPTTVVNLTPPYRPLEDGGFLASPHTVFSLFASGSPSGIAMTEYQVNGGPWQEYAPFSILQPGEHTIRFKSTDRLGNSESAKTVRVVIDQTSPVTEIHIGEPKFLQTKNKIFVSPATPLKLTATSPVVGIARSEYRIDNKRWSDTMPFTIPEEGNHQIGFKSTDTVGNAEKARSLQVTVDATPPLTTLVMNGKKAAPADVLYRRETATVTLNSADGLSGVRTIAYQLDGKEWKDYTTPIQLKGDKEHKISFRSIDNVGNEESAQTVTINYDAAPPISNISIGYPHIVKEHPYVAGLTTFTITATDAASGVDAIEYRIGTSQWRRYEPFSISAPGKHLIEYRSRDKAGNEEAPRPLQVTVDLSLPVTTLSVGGKPASTTGPLYLNGKNRIELKGMSPVWKIEHTQYRLDEGEWNVYAQPILLEDEGEYVLDFHSSDAGGNEEAIRSVTVIVDSTPPQSNLVVGSPGHERDGVFHIEPGTILTPVATDELSGVDLIEHQLQGQGVESDSVPFSIATMGKYKLTYWSIDKAGNKESPKSIVLQVSPAPTRFSEEDLLLANELISEQPADSDASPVGQVEEKPVIPQPPVLAEIPPDVFEPLPPPQQPPKKSFLNWTMGILQGLLIIGVLAL